METPKDSQRVIQQIIHDGFMYYHIKALSVMRPEGVVVLVPYMKEDRLLLMLGNIMERLTIRLIDTTIYIGIGNVSNNLS